MKTVTITLEYTVPLPVEYENLKPEELINDLNRMYDIHGKGIVQTLNADDDYSYTRVTHIDDDPVYAEDAIGGQRVSEQGMDIILDGQQFNSGASQ